MNLLEVRSLFVEFKTGGRWFEAVSGINLNLQSGEILGLVGESGCGKSTAAYSMMQLLPTNARIASGEIWLNGSDLLKKSEDELRGHSW